MTRSTRKGTSRKRAKKKNGTGKKKFFCPFYTTRPNNMEHMVLCSGVGFWPRCEQYLYCETVSPTIMTVNVPNTLAEDS